MYNLSIVKEWDMRLIDKTVIPRMPWHDISLCMVRPVFKFSVLKEIFYFYCNLKTTLYSSANLFWMSHVIFVTDGISLSSLNLWTSKRHLSWSPHLVVIVVTRTSRSLLRADCLGHTTLSTRHLAYTVHVKCKCFVVVLNGVQVSHLRYVLWCNHPKPN